MKDGPERELVARYTRRAADAGRALGFSGPDVVEIPESRAARPEERKAQEAAAIARAAGGSPLVCFDERGLSWPSEKIAGWLGERRDSGGKTLAFAIGGADGLSEDVRRRAVSVWCFGAATFPHQIVRILAAEQLYRAMTILAGHPYHRGE